MYPPALICQGFHSCAAARQATTCSEGEKQKNSSRFFFPVACVLLPSHGMESLFGLLEASRWISEVLGREELKGSELGELRFSVSSVSQSINLFSESLPPEDKEFVFKSNQVFPELAKVLSSAKEVLEKFSPAAIANGKEAKEKGGLKSMLTSSMKQGSRTLQDGLEAISGGVGNLASDWLGLPEDQLGSIRQANMDIQKLLPQLQLAISAVSIRSTFSSKRSAETLLESEQVQRPRTLADGEVSGHALPVEESEVKRPILELKLVSDAPYAQDMELPRITTLDLRPKAGDVSSMSLETESSPSDLGVCKLVLGRVELCNKKVSFEVPTPNRPTAVNRFVSRDFLQLDVPEATNVGPTQGTVEMATLALDFWDTSQEMVESASMAHVCGLHETGLHIRRKGETRWRFNARGEKVEVMEGDRVALVMESPPGSVKRPPLQDLEAEQAICILGCELKAP